MTADHGKRKLAAILNADGIGYTRLLMGDPNFFLLDKIIL
jgi:hypothetical protein